jgi:predicted helicase
MPEKHLPFDDFLNHLREAAKNTRDQGDKFEVAMVAVLPQLRDWQFAEAWLWKDWPQREAMTGLDARDIGIDIVARLQDSDEYWAVQCKFYDPASTIAHGDLGTFFTASGRTGFSGRLIITTTDNWTGHADSMLENQQIETHRLRLKELQDLDISWNWVRPDETKVLRDRHKELYPLQKEAFVAAKAHFAEHDRGRLVMACGTGKTFTSLKIAEELVGAEGYVLFVVPSLSLMKQTISEWAWERARDHRYFGICSDTTVSKSDENSTHLADLTIPVSTNPTRIVKYLTASNEGKDTAHRLNVVFCTYQSLDRLSLAQHIGAPQFDLIICDEAHRTTGIDREFRAGSNQKNSNFVKIHEQDFIKGKKRLYMTATPRIYTEAAQAKAVEHKHGVYSMDNEAHYGKEFYRLGFARAVDENMLSDYKVIVLVIAGQSISDKISGLDKDVLADLNPTTNDAAKIIGCYKSLRDQGEKDGIKLKRAVSFSNTIKNSELVVEKFTKVVEALNEQKNDGFTCHLDHVDGKQNALARAKKLDWLKADAPPTEDGHVCRILSNARCLTEGVDVPSLDAIMFMNPRKSQVDVVQAVGRVMRKAEGKKYGYVILPVVVPEGEDIEAALDDNETFAVVWEVLRALRSHDDRLTSYINQLELNKTKPDNFNVIGEGFGVEDSKDVLTKTDAAVQLDLAFSEEMAGMIYAKIVDKVGDKRYLEQWAKQTAKIHDLLVSRIDELRANHDEIKAVYDNFLTSLKASINDGLTEDDATSMLAQQLITRPIFDALFQDYQFSQNNVVSTTLDKVLSQLNEYKLDTELKDLTDFYESVAHRISGLDNDEARQKVITELYEKFFATAFPKTSESLGIAYTPIELVDFTLNSADAIMQAEFNRGLTDKDVHIIDPFTGTGSFLVRLLSNPELIKDSDLKRKFTSELWANELLLLAYYIASVNIETAYHQRKGKDYQPFPGISLTDTFELFEQGNKKFPEMLEGNSERITKQRNAPIKLVVGNPPWSGGQKSSNDNNANRTYPELDKSIRSTYANRSNTTNLNALYDSYIRSIRWASDRIGDEGMVAFVTNAGWLDGASTDGMRLCLEEEFDAIYLFNLRGNARLSGEAWRKEGDKIFGQASRAPVVISLFVKNPAKKRAKAEIHYHDIGDYLSLKEKFDILRKANSIINLDCKTITPNAEGDWLNQRDPIFQSFVELGNPEVKRGKTSQPETIFRNFSSGVKTNRDAWAYNFSHEEVSKNMTHLIDTYNEQVDHLKEAKKQNNSINPDSILDMNPTRISWDRELRADAEKGRQGAFDAQRIVPSLYRPFTMEYLYFDRQFINMVYRQPSYFPTPDSQNRLICVTGKGSALEFSCTISPFVADVNFFTPAQTFPRWIYHEDKVTGKMVKEDNITNHALERFKTYYKDSGITKDRIFDYIYGILHAWDYRNRFATDLRLGLPRVPMAEDFWVFADAGAALAHLHLGWPLDGDPLAYKDLGLLVDDKPTFPDMIPIETFQVKKMAWQNRPEGKFIKYSQRLSIGPIPEDALHYTIGNRSPLQWIIDRYQVKIDRPSGIINDPNNWIDEQKDEQGNPKPDALIQLIKRVTYLSIETARIIRTLPNAVRDEK